MKKRTVRWVARRAVKEGTLLLAVKLHFLDELLHSVEFAPHPEDPDRTNLSFMADEFHTVFVPAPEGAAERDRDIERIQQTMRDINASISSDVSQTFATTPLIAPGGPRPSTTDFVRNMDKTGALQSRMDRAVETATAAKTEIEAKQQLIRSQTELLMRYFLEKPQVAIAGLNHVIETGRELTEGVKTLSFYNGDDVTVTALARGESAPGDEPLTLYQNMLFLDEELAVDLLDQGFDFTAVPELGSILSADATLLERMIPASRGAVLVRIRRESKDYFPGQDDIASALQNGHLNLENDVTYLLVRDGASGACSDSVQYARHRRTAPSQRTEAKVSALFVSI